MIVPLSARGRTLGAITLVLDGMDRRYGPEDLALAQELAGRAALAVDNARLFQEQRHIASTLQRSLLPPRLPTIPRVETAARYRAAGEGNEVGGDFFDVFQAGDDEWAVVIGDVCGRGPEAAAVTGLARHTLRAAVLYEHQPSRLLDILNESLLEQVGDDRFCTICYVRLRPNPAGVRLTFSSGGHPLPLVLRARGGLEVVGRPGSLLGLFPHPAREDFVVDLEPDDALFLYTDGLTEARVGGKVFGEERLASLLASCIGLDAESVAGAVEQAVEEHQPGSLRDDLALLVLRVLPA
jgi:serine phosphatase RsbU (regulator of sigma subunit)